MKTLIKEIYKCDHCNKVYLKKTAAINHEIICLKNPINNRPCFGCPLLTKKETTVYYDQWDGSESERKVELLYCQAKKIFLHTPKNEMKKNAFELGYESNEPMPKECDVEINDEFLKSMENEKHV